MGRAEVCDGNRSGEPTIKSMAAGQEFDCLYEKVSIFAGVNIRMKVTVPAPDVGSLVVSVDHRFPVCS